jgi:hypothetical protein
MPELHFGFYPNVFKRLVTTRKNRNTKEWQLSSLILGNEMPFVHRKVNRNRKMQGKGAGFYILWVSAIFSDNCARASS